MHFALPNGTAATYRYSLHPALSTGTHALGRTTPAALGHMSTSTSLLGWTKEYDGPVAFLVAVGDLALSAVLLWSTIASGITFGGPNDTEQAAMQQTQNVAQTIWGGWLAAGLLIAAALRMPRTAMVHLAAMLAVPGTFVAYVAAHN